MSIVVQVALFLLLAWSSRATTGDLYDSSLVLRQCPIDELPSRCTQLKFSLCADEVLRALEMMREMHAPFVITNIIRSLGYSLDDAKRECIYRAIRSIVGGVYISGPALGFLVSLNQNHMPTHISADVFEAMYKEEHHMPACPSRPSRCKLHKWYLGVINPNIGKAISSLGLHRVPYDYSQKKKVPVYAPSDANIKRLIEMEIDRLLSKRVGIDVAALEEKVFAEKRKRELEDDAGKDDYVDEKLITAGMDDANILSPYRFLQRHQLSSFQLEAAHEEYHHWHDSWIVNWELTNDIPKRDVLALPPVWPVGSNDPLLQTNIQDEKA